MTMTIKTITRILDAHSITYYVTNGKVLAESNYTINSEPFTEIVDLTNASKQQLLDWLGY